MIWTLNSLVISVKQQQEIRKTLGNMMLLEKFPLNVLELIPFPGLTKSKTTSLLGTVPIQQMGPTFS